MLDYSVTDKIFNIFAHFLAMFRKGITKYFGQKKFVKTLRVPPGVLSFTQRSAVHLTDSVLSNYAAYI